MSLALPGGMSSSPRTLAILLALALCAPSALRAQAPGTNNAGESDASLESGGP